jgi:hypothetical protein
MINSRASSESNSISIIDQPEPNVSIKFYDPGRFIEFFAAVAKDDGFREADHSES